ncbi:MAG: hypothetical protein LPK19_16200, partial [Hymenobacteraceae bacterium]|nr:hypothetical protein [Hymenobacteraceae bacterium]MDX5513865.1 hypothetical protein [Hymenobacteraceae bacterium]
MKTTLYRLLPFRQLILLSFLMLFSAVSSYSQTFEWEKIIGMANVQNQCDASANIYTKRYVFGGVYSSMQTGMGGYLVFTNSNGDTINTKKYPQYHNGRIKSLAATPDSTFLAIGSYYDTLSGFSAGFLFKANAQGDIIWQKQYPQVYVSNKNKLLTVPDGYLYISQDDIQLTKFDGLGNIIWQKSDARAGGHDITLLKDGSYLASGFIRDPNSPSSQSNYYKTSPYLVQLRPNGDTIRTKILGSVYDHDLLNTARQTSDGGLILAGRYVQNTNGTRMQGLVIKLDSDCNQEWQQFFYPKTGAYNDGCELFNVQET